ncbi:MAG: DUF2635 domain-containing protein [Chitinispirillia bacterium]|nr:DUF2635 domain-containing protein [Chitinispirillia bacterium]MCL2268600.1 DUF2635 domain-containing protein [Chitinispirillia bacterium]
MIHVKVMAKPGCMCPQEDPKAVPVNDTVGVDVPLTPYYRRRIADGSLLLAVNAEDVKPTTASNKKVFAAKENK